jgi:hypothetical protein
VFMHRPGPSYCSAPPASAAAASSSACRQYSSSTSCNSSSQSVIQTLPVVSPTRNLPIVGTKRTVIHAIAITWTGAVVRALTHGDPTTSTASFAELSCRNPGADRLNGLLLGHQAYPQLFCGMRIQVTHVQVGTVGISRTDKISI